MSKSLGQYQLTEKIRISMFKHRGNVLAISSELNLNIDLVRKYVKKLKKMETRDANVMICNNLMTHLLFSHKQRIYYLEDMLKSLEGMDSVYKCSRCSKVVSVVEYDSEKQYACNQMGMYCSMNLMNRTDIYELKVKLLCELRNEDSTLVSFAKDMGLVSKEETPKAFMNQGFFIVNNGNRENKDSMEYSNSKIIDINANSDLEQALVKNLTSSDRKQIISKLEQELVRAIEGESKK